MAPRRGLSRRAREPAHSGASGHDAARPGTSASGTSASGRSQPGAGRPGTTTAGGTRPATGRQAASGQPPAGAPATLRPATVPRTTVPRTTVPRTTVPPAGAAPARAAAALPGTSCGPVAHIGDSTSVGMVSPLDLPDPAQRLAAQYTGVGVRHTWIDASGGRSMVERCRARSTASIRPGIWPVTGSGLLVTRSGTNDTANVAVGSSVGRHGPDPGADVGRARRAGHVGQREDPRLVGPVVRGQHAALERTPCSRPATSTPNLRIFDWASAAQDGWFISDGIHYTSAGYAARAHRSRARWHGPSPAPAPVPAASSTRSPWARAACRGACCVSAGPAPAPAGAGAPAPP